MNFNPRSPRGERLLSSVYGLTPLLNFNPRSPRGERHGPLIACIGHLGLFQSTLPAGGATKNCRRIRGKNHISIHAPRGGSDIGIRSPPRYSGLYFNPRSPRGERLESKLLAYSHLRHFNPRSPRGERLMAICALVISFIFQSTLPAGGATTDQRQTPDTRRISIHAPRGGSDSKSACFLCENLSIYHKFCTQIFLKAFPPLLST